MNDYDRLTRERLLAEVRSRLQTNLGPHSRDLFEHALESISEGSCLFLKALEDALVSPVTSNRSLQNQPVGVESKPATLRCLIHIRLLDADKRLFNIWFWPAQPRDEN
jgi:DNA-binding transcriptional regulator YbjK